MALINYNDNNNETTNISLRSVRIESWKALKKLAALEEKTIAEYLDQLVREKVEDLSNRE